MGILYHYTDEDGLRAIQRDGCIRPSSDVSDQASHSGPGGRYGSGVYLTDMNPRDHDRKDVARNNYRAGWEKHLGKTDHFVEIKIPDDDLRLRLVYGRTWLYEDQIDRDMFHSSGLNRIWNPAFVTAAVAGVAIGAAVSMYSSYQEQKSIEETKKANEVEERQRAELKRSMELKDAITPTFWQNLKESPTPSDFVASCRNVGNDVDDMLAALIQKAFFVVVAALGGVAYSVSFATSLQAMSVFVFLFLMHPSPVCDYTSFDVPSHVTNAISDEDRVLFLQKDDSGKSQASWLGSAVSWLMGSSPRVAIDHRVDISKRAFGLICVATVSLPLAACPSLERKYYWIGALGRWYAVTVYHYLHAPCSKKYSEYNNRVP